VGGAHVLYPHARVSSAAYPAILEVAHCGIRHGGPFHDGGVVDTDGGPGIGDVLGRVFAAASAVTARERALERSSSGSAQQPKPGAVSQRAV
jgi:hypothetical protein